MKGVDLICELSLLSLLCTNLSGTSQTHIWGENCCLCVSVCVSLKCSTFHWPEYTLSLCAGKMWRRQHNSFDLYTSLLFFFPSMFLLFGCVISLYWVTRFPRVTEGTCCSPLDFFTSWTERNFPWYRVKTASCHSHLPLIKDWNQEREKVCNLVKVKRHVTEESW